MKAEQRTPAQRNSRARGRALTRLVDEYRDRYKELYAREGRVQRLALRALSFEHPDRYRVLYLEEKQKLIDGHP